MNINWKDIKESVAIALEKPGAKRKLLYIGGALATVVLLVVLVVLIRGARNKTTYITDGDASSIQLVFGGDLNVTDNTVASGDLTDALLDVAEIFAAADAACLNLEGNFAGSPYGSDSRSAPDSWATDLAAMGVDFVQMANSYSVKNGMIGLSQTLTTLRQAGLRPLGAYATNEEYSQSKGYYICYISGVKVAFVAFTKGMDGMSLPGGSEDCVNLLYTDYYTAYSNVDTEGITAVLEAVAKQKPDITIALVHWGSEDNDNISKSQKTITDLMLENGVDAIIGTHSHRLQEVVYDEQAGTLVAYSLGDLYGDGTNSGNQYSVLLQLEITKNWDTGEAAITGWSYVPIYTVTEARDGEQQRLLQIEPALEAYENNAIDRVGDRAYQNMLTALEKIKAILEPKEE